MDRAVFRTFEFLGVINGDAFAVVTAASADGMIESGPQVRGTMGRVEVFDGEERSADAQWSKHRSVSGFIDSCVEQHTQQGSGRSTSHCQAIATRVTAGDVIGFNSLYHLATSEGNASLLGVQYFVATITQSIECCS